MKDAKAVLAWIESVSAGMAKAKKPAYQREFMYDKPIPPRYKYWKRPAKSHT